MRFCKIVLSDQKSSSKSAQFPFTMVQLPWTHLGLAACVTPTGCLQKEGCPYPGLSVSADAGTAPHTTPHASCNAHSKDALSGIGRNANTSGWAVKHNVLELGGLYLFAPAQGAGQRHLIGELEVGAHGDAARDARHAHPGRRL